MIKELEDLEEIIIKIKNLKTPILEKKELYSMLYKEALDSSIKTFCLKSRTYNKIHIYLFEEFPENILTITDNKNKSEDVFNWLKNIEESGKLLDHLARIYSYYKTEITYSSFPGDKEEYVWQQTTNLILDSFLSNSIFPLFLD